jgi:membrane fusion protein, multidrug efflux system
VTTGFANLSDGAKVIIGKDDQTPSADLAPRKKNSQNPQGKDGQASDAKGERRGQKREAGQGENAPAQGGERAGTGAKSRP